MSAPPAALAAPPSSTSAPWWAHLLVGGLAIAGSVAMVLVGQVMIGDAGFVAGLAFLGVGAGVAATS